MDEGAGGEGYIRVVPGSAEVGVVVAVSAVVVLEVGVVGLVGSAAVVVLAAAALGEDSDARDSLSRG